MAPDPAATPGRPDRPAGFHVSIAGGLPRAVARALERGCTALQIFCGNPRAWSLSERTPAELSAFRRARRRAGLSPLAVHGCYLLNPCSPSRRVHEKTVRRLAEELELSAKLGADCYVLHPGSWKGIGPARGIERAAVALLRSAQQAGEGPPVLLENTADSHGPGGRLEWLAELLGRTKSENPPLRMGLALDTCHLFGAGFDLRREEEVQRLVEALQEHGLADQVRLLHANDARDPAGSGRDRHWHIGEGTIGRAGLRNLLCHPRLRSLPIILETPWESVQTDLKNLRALRELLARRGTEGAEQ